MKNIKKGDRGLKVNIIQAILAFRIDTDVDGIFGEDTEKNIKIFQKNNKLNSDGIVGENTLELLLLILKKHIQKIFEEE